MARRRPRGFTLAEVAIVVAVVGVVAASGVIGVSAAAERSKRQSKLKSVYAELEQVRAAHLSSSATPDSCLRITQQGASTFEFDERPDCATVAKPVLRDVGARVATEPDICIDALARPITCGEPGAFKDVLFDVEIDGRPGCDGIIVWRANGRLTASFPVDDNPQGDVQAHLTDAASVRTPEPTAIGRFAGASTDPRGLLE